MSNYHLLIAGALLTQAPTCPGEHPPPTPYPSPTHPPEPTPTAPDHPDTPTPTVVYEAERGMTWIVTEHHSETGTDKVACAEMCDPYAGDTRCDVALPILCFRKDGSPNPGVETNYYAGWSQGHLAPTRPIRGDAIGSLSEGNRLCESSFGHGWRMAEFHDGDGGWGYHGFGHVRDDTHFWVFINDQPEGNCFPIPIDHE